MKDRHIRVDRENRQSSRLGKENAKAYPKQTGEYFV